MKILFVGDYSNFHATLAKYARRAGHSATVISDGGGYLHTDADIYLSRRTGKMGAIAYLASIARLLPRLRGYDIVQLINPHFFNLRPGRLSPVFDFLKRHNGRVCLSCCGSDAIYADACYRKRIFPYSEFTIGRLPTPWVEQNRAYFMKWFIPEVVGYTRKVYSGIDAAFSALYEYDAASRPQLGEKLVYTGIPIDTEMIRHSPASNDGKPLRLFIGVRRETALFKGTELLYSHALKMARQYPELISVERAENMPLKDYLDAMHRADVVVDQLYSFTPATNALQAMAMGKIAASGGEEAFYRFIGEDSLRPVVNLSPAAANPLEPMLALAADKEMRRRLADEGPAFVERYNRADKVTAKFIERWESLL